MMQCRQVRLACKDCLVQSLNVQGDLLVRKLRGVNIGENSIGSSEIHGVVAYKHRNIIDIKTVELHQTLLPHTLPSELV